MAKVARAFAQSGCPSLPVCRTHLYGVALLAGMACPVPVVRGAPCLLF
ncbi:hypothetical protein NKW53_03530 [Acetobacter orientalis]|nr:hypothetical protein [Acetobacter orientalis]MCP1215143.1 hypothetical protein [Acetobacter orientalis]MCP1218726.1 hypothetical protein [Acetobacter orientalis]